MIRSFLASAGMAAMAIGLTLPTVAHASAAVQDVNTALLNSIRAGAAGPPPRAARAIAMVGIALLMP